MATALLGTKPRADLVSFSDSTSVSISGFNAIKRRTSVASKYVSTRPRIALVRSKPKRDAGLQATRASSSSNFMFQSTDTLNDSVNHGFSFSAAGLLFPYHLGVVQCLQDHGFLTDATSMAGSSAGSLICALVACGVSPAECMELTRELCDDCRLGGTRFRLGPVLRSLLERHLPENAHELVSGRCKIAVTQVFPQTPRGLLIDRFHDRNDLIDALITSCFIPGYLYPYPVTRFRNSICFDGGFTNFMPQIEGSHTVRVCAFPIDQLGQLGQMYTEGSHGVISPEPDRRAIQQLFAWALQPADDHELDELYLHGYEDANVWCLQESLKLRLPTPPPATPKALVL